MEPVFASLGDSAVTSACNEIAEIGRRTAVVMLEYNHTRETTLPMLFADDVIAKMHAVRGMVTAQRDIKDYMILPNIKLSIDFTGARLPAIDEDFFKPDHNRVQPLLHYIKGLEAIYLQFEEVKAVLRWMNRNATPGAIRHYWPTAMRLCPDSGLPDEMPSRHKTPAGINVWLQQIRDTANTMVSALMLPTTTLGKQRDTMWVTMMARKIELAPSMVDPGYYGGRAAYETDAVAYHL